MSSKENMPPAQSRKSKIPIPHMQPSKALRKGIKRAISPNACKSDPKRSPSTSKKSAAKGYGKSETVQRKTLGELPCEQRRIVKVRRALNENSSVKHVGMKRQPNLKCGSLKGERSRAGNIFPGIDLNDLPDQSGIEFEKDDSALQSILDETGIQYEQPQLGNQHAGTKLIRHTLAAVPKPQRESTAPSRVKVCVEDFRKVCDDFINRASNKQPNPKRPCRETGFRKDDNFNLKLTPSKTDFCTKFGVQKSVTFQGVTPGQIFRQSLPGRTRVGPPDPFVVSGRSSMVQTPRRLAVVGEEEEGLGTLSRPSLATPLRILKKVKNVDDGLQSVEESNSMNRKNLQHQMLGRVSLSAQTPGRVSLSAQAPGRVSLSAKSPGRVSLSAQAPGRVSLSAQTPSHVSLSAQNAGRQSLAPQTPARVSLFDKNGNGSALQNVGRFSLAAQPPGRVSFSAQTPGRVSLSAQPPGQVSLSAQTPGRVSLSARQNPDPRRVSMMEQTPGRVKKQGTDNINMQADSQNICENLVKKFTMQTPGRVQKKENMVKKDNGVDKEDQRENTLPDRVRENKQTDSIEETKLSGTPNREKAVPMCATPLRVKILQTDENTPRSTPPQRVLKAAPTKQQTPKRVQTLCNNSPAHTPRPGTPQEPMRVPKIVSTPATPRRILITETKSPAGVPQQCLDSIKQVTPHRKSPTQNRPTGGVDLRTIWKTKKTPSKSPILKEVLTQEPDSEACTPQNSHTVLKTVVSANKKKKTLTWADALESCQSPGTRTVETKDERWEPLQVKTQIFHDAMQDNPHQEKTSSSPDKDTHATTLTNTQNSQDNMQLPVCLTGSSSTYSASTSGSIDVENKPNGEDPSSKADHCLVTHPTSFAQLETDSLLVSQPEVGQHNSNVLANKTQDEFLQKQIELFEEKKRQLAQLQMQIQEQLYKASGPGPLCLDHEVDNGGLAQNKTSQQTTNRNTYQQSDDYLPEQVKLDNEHFSRNLNICNQDFKYTSDTCTQGINVSRQVNLDLNSNVTGTGNTYDCLHSESILETQSSPSPHSSDTFLETHIFSTPTQQKLDFGPEGDITPYILKSKSELNDTVKERTAEVLKDREVERVTNKETDESEQSFNVDQSCITGFDEKRTEPVSVPLWTPLAMKTVAKQQTVDKDSEEQLSAKTGNNFENRGYENVDSDKKPKTEIYAKSEIDTCVFNSENIVNSGLVPKESISKDKTELESLNKQCPKTPPTKKSAFRSISSTSLTPVVGSLSLRANTEVKRQIGRMHPTESLHHSVLLAAKERYLEALLDDEVALFMCRLSPGGVVGKGRNLCHNPVAKILLNGDDMHFIPIEMDESLLDSVHIEGSAFTKYAVRAT